MVERQLLEIFNDCVEQMVAGQSINDCLRRYPQYADALRPMLEVGSLIDRTQIGAFEVADAQARVRTLVRARLNAPPPRRSYAGIAALVASLLLVIAAVFAAAENSLPGDALYGVKRFSENARSAVIGEQFAERRIDEVRVLLALKRPAQVDFTGEVEAIDDTHWTINGLDLSVSAVTPGADTAAVGDRVHVDASVTDQGELVAQALQMIERRDAITLTLIPTNTPTPTATLTPTPTPTITPTVSLTATTAPRATDTQTPIPTATPMDSAMPTASQPPAPTQCSPTQPPGWVSYVVQAGDTVAGLAANTGASVEQIVAVNCLPETLMIIVGQKLTLPALPALQPPGQQPNTAVQPTQDDHGNQGSGGDDRGGNSGSGSDNSGSGSSGSGGGHGPG